MLVISHPQLNPLEIRLKAEDDSHFRPLPFSFLGDPGAVSPNDAIFSGRSLFHDVNFRLKISRRPKISRRLTAPGSPRMTFQPTGVQVLSVSSGKDS